MMDVPENLIIDNFDKMCYQAKTFGKSLHSKKQIMQYSSDFLDF